MTYCLGIRVRDGLMCLADGRLTSGMQSHSAGKVSMHHFGDNDICIMTSGLRSIRDKTLAYFDDLCEEVENKNDLKLRHAINIYTQALRQVGVEDREALQRSNLHFDLHTLISGQLNGDDEPMMYLVYPEGNWIEINERTPYMTIGATSYGKPFLDRALRYDTTMDTVIKIAYLSFDSTRISTVDVGYPIDMLTYTKEHNWRHAVYEYDDLAPLYNWWNEHLSDLIAYLPDKNIFKSLVED
ncbi:hypothetical protein [Pseudemcibacter aquimaris]|uniref:hypothetical protein n=1 Tax=Pseudemcibacter aquimaris TaxID=2857064 RepID=UPI0020124BD6|nr:hypothetical protein [Pseudemcibacter aquimaris]MCC3861132.1 hypothetical protein [Pseudemcibacter aquimaris]WDU59949.1 hypothetical protein KW060_06730 [Pseudemcibacter aquimaris]